MDRSLSIHEKKRNNRNLHPIKVTALVYLREVLLAEKYEECSEIIKIGREFGATNREVHKVLNSYSRTLKPAKSARSPKMNLSIRRRIWS